MYLLIQIVSGCEDKAVFSFLSFLLKVVSVIYFFPAPPVKNIALRNELPSMHIMI